MNIFRNAFGHLSGPQEFRITVPNERKLLESKHLIAAPQIRLDLINLVNGHLPEYIWPLFGHLSGPPEVPDYGSERTKITWE